MTFTTEGIIIRLVLSILVIPIVVFTPIGRPYSRGSMIWNNKKGYTVRFIIALIGMLIIDYILLFH